MRDEHDLMSSSTSPPPKKTKVSSIDESEDDLSFKFEEMEIDIETIASSEATLKERSDMMDEEIKLKSKRTDERDLLIQKKKKESIKKKRIQEKIKLEKLKKETKKRKQKKKDEQKRIKKKVVENNVNKKPQMKVPNIRNIPENCAHLVNKDDLLYVGPGDGCCGPNCAAAFLFHDEVFGPNLRKRMNQFQAKHWYNRYQYI